MKRQLLIDTDPGVDDALALFFALGLESVELTGATTCFGNSSLDVVTRNARFILDCAGARNTPVWAGSSRPQRGEPPKSVVHGAGALGEVSIPGSWPGALGARASDRSAVDALSHFGRTGDAAPRTLVAMGPLTNLAHAISADRGSLTGLERIVVLGGTFAGPGNKGPAAEFNFRCDPEAADFVLAQAPCEVVVIPLDVCMQNVLTVDDFSAVSSPAFREFLSQLCSSYSAANDAEEGIRGIIMYDPLAVFCAAHPEHFTLEPYWMRVDTGDSFARGMSIVDRRLRTSAKPNVLVATRVDWGAFVRFFFGALERVPFRAI